MPTRNSYNIRALQKALERDSATPSIKYDKTSKRSRIEFICHCGQEGEKSCLEIVDRAGAFCKECTRNNSINKLHKTRNAACTLETLNIILKRDNAQSVITYDVITKNTDILFKCNCGEESEKNCHQLIIVSGAFCKQCTRKKWTDNIKKTNLERYNVECTAQAPHIKEIIKQTNLLNYSVENVLASPIIQEKIKQTLIERYGVEHPSQSPEIREKIKQTCLVTYSVENVFQVEEFKDKQKQTLLERYGVEHISQTQDFKDKFKQTCLEKYGVQHPLQAEEFREKVTQAFINHYGVTNPNKVPEIREKIRQTNLERYNVEYPSQSQEIQEKAQKNAKKYKEYKMPSGELRRVQGYEPLALEELLKTYREEDIKTDRKDVPRISYKCEDKQRYYFPDIYIPSENKIIEVKSTWTYNCKTDNIELKSDATKAAGYNYEIWIYNNKGNKSIK
jgi:L-rhamnose mutarotase